MTKICRLSICALLVLGFSALAQSQVAPVPYYVQLIWGTNREKPENAQFRPVGPKLKSELSSVFKWQQYWEVKRQLVKVTPGKATSVRLSPECEVEIEFVSPGLRETRIYGKHVLVARSRQKSECHSKTIHGATIETGGSWFVVVREDAPTDK